jgi:hypothetical protein
MQEEKDVEKEYGPELKEGFQKAIEKWLMLPRWMRVWKPPQEVNRSVECARRLKQMSRGGKNG